MYLENKNEIDEIIKQIKTLKEELKIKKQNLPNHIFEKDKKNIKLQIENLEEIIGYMIIKHILDLVDVEDNKVSIDKQFKFSKINDYINYPFNVLSKKSISIDSIDYNIVSNHFLPIVTLLEKLLRIDKNTATDILSLSEVIYTDDLLEINYFNIHNIN